MTTRNDFVYRTRAISWKLIKLYYESLISKTWLATRWKMYAKRQASAMVFLLRRFISKYILFFIWTKVQDVPRKFWDSDDPKISTGSFVALLFNFIFSFLFSVLSAFVFRWLYCAPRFVPLYVRGYCYFFLETYKEYLNYCFIMNTKSYETREEYLSYYFQTSTEKLEDL